MQLPSSQDPKLGGYNNATKKLFKKEPCVQIFHTLYKYVFKTLQETYHLLVMPGGQLRTGPLQASSPLSLKITGAKHSANHTWCDQEIHLVHAV